MDPAVARLNPGESGKFNFCKGVSKQGKSKGGGGGEEEEDEEDEEERVERGTSRTVFVLFIYDSCW